MLSTLQESSTSCHEPLSHDRLQDGSEGEYTVHFNSYEEGGKVGKPDSVKVDAVIGADGANSRVAKEIDAGMLSS